MQTASRCGNALRDSRTLFRWFVMKCILGHIKPKFRSFVVQKWKRAHGSKTTIELGINAHGGNYEYAVTRDFSARPASRVGVSAGQVAGSKYCLPPRQLRLADDTARKVSGGNSPWRLQPRNYGAHGRQPQKCAGAQGRHELSRAYQGAKSSNNCAQTGCWAGSV